MLIRDILTVKGPEIHSISPDRPLSEAVRLMVRHAIGSVVIMGKSGMVGLLTERDIVLALDRRGGDLGDPQVSEIMVTDPIIGNPEDTVDYVRGVMTDNRVTHLPVMEGDKLLGIISFHDVARACLSEANFENLLLKRYIKQWPE